ncbi:inhibitor of nuclear factor kappa-B kinase subunit epsilon-like [Mizuhopecten yessoensis]|uniref:IkappaB kinase n=1 Tax=Mizuhopecten yessoensis TaxID=6573 RepID=A0A210R4G5_MIZYE|nr:inhibitor of nuclear factor kappa-B kinase subunit epsilon-like [Mizuhopecten yessoensis]OWF55892.1 Inhibitor of nuclear factor kappa-B kinase subunit epsilon [Mizuhopecten yessoensis]
MDRLYGVEGMKETDSHVYCTQDLLGRGATGDVYKGINKTTGEVVALKMFEIKFTSHIQREVEALVKLQHPNIVRFSHCEKDSLTKRNVLVMELCEKGSLLDLLKEPENGFGMDEEEFLRVFEHLVNGTKHLRNQGFSHRDIKPGNVLIFTDDDGSNVYKLSDFGTAKPLGDKDCFMSLVGTEEYLHPDIYKAAFIDNRNCQGFDISADMWSLGVTLYHAATGQVPFHAYGGRFDKAKTYEILSNKAKGVISGEQLVSGGPIVWSRDLPNTCKLSRPLRDRTRDILVRMFDSAKDTSWGFDDFFDAADTLIDPSVHQLHIFSSLNGQHYRLFLDRDSRYKNLSEDIKRITGLAVDEQVTLCENGDIVGTLMQDTPIYRYPHTSRADPLVLMPTKTAGNGPPLFKIEGFDKVIDKPCAGFPTVVNTDHDYRLAKKMCEVIHLSRKMVRSAVLSQKLLTRTIARHGSMFDQKIRQHRRDFDFIWERFDDVSCFTTDEMKKHAQGFACVSKDGEVIDDNFDNIRDKLQTCGKRLKNVRDEYDAAKEAWNISDSTVLQNQRWEGKADRIVELSKARLQKFRDYRCKNRLSYHEQKLFAFDRKAMEDLNKKALHGFEDCRQSLAETHLKFIVWHRHYTGFSKSIKDLGGNLEDLRSSIGDLVKILQGVPETLPAPQKPASLIRKSLAQDMKFGVDGFGKELTEHQSLVEQTREQITSMSELLKDMHDDLPAIIDSNMTNT